MSTPSTSTSTGGRSPYPTRSRSRRIAQQQDGDYDNEVEVADSVNDHGNNRVMMHVNDERERQSRMRMPRTSLGSIASAGSSSTTTVAAYRLGKGLVQAKLSPTTAAAAAVAANGPQGAQGTQASKQSRFFPSAAKKNKIPKNPQDSFVVMYPTQSDDDSLMDGMPIVQLRHLAENPKHPPDIAVFYAGLVYAKTQSKEDAYLYASLMVQNKEYKRAVRLLETTAGLLHYPSLSSQSFNTSLTVPATLLAAQALGHLEEWQSVLTLLEDNTLYASILASSSSSCINNTSFVLEDDNDMAWFTLGEHVQANYDHPDATTSAATTTTTTTIHPLSLLMHFRATAYAKTGHPLRASLFWKRALQFDVRCVPALEGLLESTSIGGGGGGDSSTSPMQVILEQVQFPKHFEFLKDYYMAKLVNIPTTEATTKHKKEAAAAAAAPFWHDDNDTSSIQLISPKNMDHTYDQNSSVLAMQNDNDETKIDKHHQHSWQVALDELWKTHKLQKSSQVLAMAAERAYQQHDFHRALKLCEELHTLDPLCPTAGFTYVATLVSLQKKRPLFQLAHEWVDAAPKSSKAWFAVGAYYYACQRYHVAQRHFCRATRLDPHSPNAWIAFGTSFAMCDESDQALASFRAAQRLSPGDSISLLYIGMEYLRTNHMVLAHHFLQAAHQANPTDPLVCNEMGVLYMTTPSLPTSTNESSATIASPQTRFTLAVEWLTKALVLATGHTPTTDNDEATILDLMHSTTLQTATNGTYWEPTLFNLATAFRKLRKFQVAIECLTTCLTWKESPGAFSALGYCHHLMHHNSSSSSKNSEHIHMAIEYYHQSLSRKPDDPFCTKMLEQSLVDALEESVLIPSNNDSMLATEREPPKSFLATTTPTSQDQSSMMLSASGEDAGFSFSVDHDDDSDVDMG